jgi:hypothetical protein
MTVMSMTACDFAPVHRRGDFETGLAWETPGASGPGGFNAMEDLVPRTRQRSTTSGIDHWLVREKFRHLTPSGTEPDRDDPPWLRIQP